MVCMDGFILTHAFEEVDVPEQAQVDAYLPPYEPRQQLDPAAAVSIGALVGPEAYTEVRYLAHQTQLAALQEIPRLADEFSTVFGRPCPALVNPYRVDGAELVVVALGSVLGTVAEVVDELRGDGFPDRGARDHDVPTVPGRSGTRAVAAGRAGSRARAGVGGRVRWGRVDGRPGSPIRTCDSTHDSRSWPRWSADNKGIASRHGPRRRCGQAGGADISGSSRPVLAEAGR